MKIIFVLIFTLGLFCSCTQKNTSPDTGSTTTGVGVGPVTLLSIDSKIDPTLVEKGKKAFESKCIACHKVDERYVGPALKGVTKRRKPEWIVNMILNPTEMTQKDETAKALLGEFMTQMTNQNVNQDDARAILEHFRNIDSAP